MATVRHCLNFTRATKAEDLERHFSRRHTDGQWAFEKVFNNANYYRNYKYYRNYYRNKNKVQPHNY